MSSLGLFGIFESSCNGKGRDPVSCIFHTIIPPVVAGLASLLPYTVQTSDTCFCGVLLSCMWYTK
jgi:hypothetical protein